MTQPQAKELKIGLWGGPQSGKTHYIAMLTTEIIALSKLGFSIRQVPVSEVPLTMSAYMTAGLLKGKVDPNSALELGQKFVTGHQWLDRTIPGLQGVKTFRFRITREIPARDNRPAETHTLLLTLTDAGGEWYRHPFRAWDKYAGAFAEAKQKNPLELLNESDGVICLIDSHVVNKGVLSLNRTDRTANPTQVYGEVDPENLPLRREELPEAFRLLCEIMHIGKNTDKAKLDTPIAICLTKVDQPVLWERRDNPDELERWTDECFKDCSPKLPDQIKNDCERSHWFGVSVVGCITNRAGEPESPTDDENNLLKNAPIRPCNLYKPIAWLASVLEGGSSVWNI